MPSMIPSPWPPSLPTSPASSHSNKRPGPSAELPRSPKRVCPLTPPSAKLEPTVLPPLPFEDTLPPEDLGSPSTASSAPPSPPALPLHGSADKFTKSRAVGQVHRDKERHHINQIELDVEDLSTERVLLFALVCCSADPNDPDFRTDEHDLRLPSDRPEDYGISLAEAQSKELIAVGCDTAQRLGVQYISRWTIRVLLEYIAVRRNYVPLLAGPNRRRRSSVRVAPGREDAGIIAEYAYDMFCREAFERKAEDPVKFVDGKLGSLMYLLDKWSKYEHNHNAPEFDWDTNLEVQYPPASPTRLDASEFGSPNRRRGEGAKRCSRCGAIKFTGSGHGRSKCDDGYSISSTIPYPASPRSDTGNSSS